MSAGEQSLGGRLKESLKFWLGVAVLCGIVGTASYYFGKDYVGRHLHEMEVRQRAPDIVPQTGSAVVTDDGAEQSPPIKPVVIMIEREPSSREERRVRRETALGRDEAEQPADEVGEGPSEDERPSEREAPSGDGERAEKETPEDTGRSASESGGGGRFVVAAGSFADETNADRQVQRLAQQGYQPYITTVERDGVTYRRVNVGVFDSREQAEQVEERLKSEGFDAAVWTE